MLKRKNKKAAIEMSIGTIVVIVIAMVMLIMGVVLVRKIMCGGILLTDKITRETESEITNLFGSDDYGVKCVGEIDQERIGSGGSRPVVCIINGDKSEAYDIKYKSSTLNDGRIPGIVKGGNLDKILISKGWKGTAPAGKTSVRVAQLNVPRDIDRSNIELDFEISKEGNLVRSPQILIELVPVGSFKAAIC